MFQDIQGHLNKTHKEIWLEEDEYFNLKELISLSYTSPGNPWSAGQARDWRSETGLTDHESGSCCCAAI